MPVLSAAGAHKRSLDTVQRAARWIGLELKALDEPRGFEEEGE